MAGEGFINTTGKDDWATPPEIIRFALSRLRVDVFSLDTAASARTAKANQYLGPDHVDPERRDGLARPWSIVGVNWCNFPYSRASGGVTAWLDKCAAESERGCVVAALFYCRTDTRAWHRNVPKASTVYLFEGRIKFIDPVTGERRAGAPAPSCLAVWEGQEQLRFPTRFIHVPAGDWKGA